MRGSPAHTPREPKYLFKHWPVIARSIRSAAGVALFLDFDGTLAPFRRRPEQVRMSQQTRDVIERLVDDPRMSVYVLSGRRRADVERRVAVRGVRCFGLHGWEGARPAVPHVRVARLLRQARHQVRRRLMGVRDVWIEEKGPIFAIHVRGAPQACVRRADNIVREVMRSFRPDLRVMRGNQVWEITPREMRGKGAAVRTLLTPRSAAPLAVYVGDDITDESAFSVLRDGITVVVGARRPTKAKFALPGPTQVRLLLQKLGRELRVANRETPGI